ncbi:hypothetical protein AB4Z01_15025 [Inquilinus sp. YAF38]|uniref:hypothetical protein n=1 Tax=Inquilinus sp. YAF38 TaxID=3233084 RepID=UPI003F93140D
MRRRLIWHPVRKEWVPPSERLVRNVQFGRGPAVIGGSLDNVLNHADGKRYSDKRAYERAVRAAGCEIVGNEHLPDSRPPEMPAIEPDIVRALEELGA